jgi:hypothetical protein
MLPVRKANTSAAGVFLTGSEFFAAEWGTVRLTLFKGGTSIRRAGIMII